MDRFGGRAGGKILEFQPRLPEIRRCTVVHGHVVSEIKFRLKRLEYIAVYFVADYDIVQDLGSPKVLLKMAPKLPFLVVIPRDLKRRSKCF